jgi:hypothetical protein
MSKASVGLVPLKDISFTWALGHRILDTHGIGGAS